MKHKLYIVLLGLLLSNGLGHAQERVPLTKSQVLDKVLESNYSLKISEAQYNSIKADFRQTNSIFLPNITASYTGFATTNPLMAFGSKLNQGILTPEDFNPALLNNPEQTQNFATIFEIKQPIINMDGIYQRRAAKSKMEATALQTERTKDYLSLEVEQAYMQLQLAYSGVSVLEHALETAEANEELAKNSFNQGLLQKSDVLAVSVRVTEVKNQLQTAKSQVDNASNYLSFLMNDKQDVIYEPADSLQIMIPQNQGLLQVSLERSDIKAMSLATDAYETMYKADKMTFLPRLNAFGSYELYDDQIFQGGASGYIFGAQLSWNILEGTKRFGKAQKSRSEFEHSKLEYNQYLSKSHLELNKAKRMLSDAENSLTLTALALEQSKESLRIRKNRFAEGLEKTTDLLLADAQYAQKQLEYYQTIYAYNYAQAYVQFLTK
jgi:outer membrane protein TolC